MYRDAIVSTSLTAPALLAHAERAERRLTTPLASVAADGERRPGPRALQCSGPFLFPGAHRRRLVQSGCDVVRRLRGTLFSGRRDRLGAWGWLIEEWRRERPHAV